LYRRLLEDPGLSVRNRAHYRTRPTGVLFGEGDTREAVSEARALRPALTKVTSVRTLNELRPVRALSGGAAGELGAQFDQIARALPA